MVIGFFQLLQLLCIIFAKKRLQTSAQVRATLIDAYFKSLPSHATSVRKFGGLHAQTLRRLLPA